MDVKWESKENSSLSGLHIKIVHFWVKFWLFLNLKFKVLIHVCRVLLGSSSWRRRASSWLTRSRVRWRPASRCWTSPACRSARRTTASSLSNSRRSVIEHLCFISYISEEKRKIFLFLSQFLILETEQIKDFFLLFWYKIKDFLIFKVVFLLEI